MPDGVRIEALRCRYPGASVDAVAGVSAVFAPGRIHALVGANGSGKTTLLKTVAGLVRPVSGAVTAAGCDPFAVTPRARALRIGFLQQETFAPPDLTVREFVRCGRYPRIPFWSRPAPEDNAAADRAIAVCGLETFADRPVGALSSGQRQLARVALLVAQETPVVLLDEPATYLDLAVQQRIYAILRGLADRGATVVLTLHDLHAVARVADDVHALVAGRLVASGAPGETLVPATVKEVFGVDVW